jgi:hypothetical protein
VERLGAGPAWIGRFRSDIEALARVEGEMPSADALRAFNADLEEVLEPREGSSMEDVWAAVSERWWARFSKLEVRRARRAVRLHLRLHELYQALAGAPDEELAAYARLREQARTSAMKQLMTDLLARRTESDGDDATSHSP